MDFCVGNGTGTNSPFGKNQFFSKANGFGQTTSTFGQPATNTSIFSPMQSSNNIFQSPNTSAFNPNPSAQAGFGANLFGQQQQQQPQPSTSGLFSATNTFGQNKTGFGFGTNQPQTALFGQQPQPPPQVQQQQSQQPQSGTSSSLFQPSATNLFGQTNAFGTQNQSGTVIKFSPVTGSDTMQKNGVTQSISTKHHCITCMKVYESKSLEELRFEDYCANRKGPQQQSGFSTSAFGVAQTAPQTTQLFGQTDNKTAFGQQASSFGQTTAATTFGQNTSGFGLTNTQNTTNLFGKSSNFGTHSNTAFGFNTTQTTNPFSANQQNKPFAQQSSLFGSQTPQAQQTGFGTNVFGQNTTQNTANLFQKPSQPTGGFNTGQTGFTFNQPVSTGQTSNLFQTTKANTSFGLFGQTNTAGIGTTGFGQAQQQSAFGTTPFGKTPIASGGVTGTTGFGQTNQTTGFSTNLTNLQPQQQQTSSLFGNAAPKQNLFGNTNTGTGLFNSNVFQPTQNTFNLPTNQHQQQQQQSQISHESYLIDRNMSVLTADIYPHGPHGKLEPIFPVSSNITTNKDEIQAILELNKKPEESSLNIRSKIKVQSPKTKRGNNFNKEFFESNKSLYGSYKRLVIKKSSNENKATAVTNIFHKYHDELLQEAERIASTTIINNNDSSSDTSQRSFTNIPIINITTNNISLSDDCTPSCEEIIKKGISLDFDDDFKNANHIDNDIKSKTNGENDEDVIFIDKENVDSATTTSSSTTSSERSNSNVAGVILTKPEYYMIPPVNKLNDFVNDKGECLIQGLTIGRKGYGNVYFPDEINIKNLNIDEIVYFRHKEIILYPDDERKPPIGEGLNRRAQVTLDKVYPRLKGTSQYVTAVSDIINGGFVDNLMFVTQKHNCKFVEYRPSTGSWVFKVNHFSKYGLTESDEENCEISPNKIMEPTNKMVTNNMSKTVGDILPKYTDLNIQTELQEDLSETMKSVEIIDDELIAFTITSSTYDENVKKRSRIQAMKATLIEISEPSSSTLVKPNIFEIFQHEQQQQQQQPILDFSITPTIHSLLSFEEDELSKISFMGQRCYSDLTFFKGGSYKVGWMKGGNFFRFNREFDVDFCYELHSVVLNMIGTKEYNQMMPILEDVLNIALEESLFEYDVNGVPTLNIKNDLSYLKKQTILFNKHARFKKLYGDERYLANIWNLCTALWGEGANSTFSRRQNLSNWLKNALCKDEVKELLVDDKLTKTEIINNIFTLLTYNNIKEAAELAIKHNLNQLCLLISQLSANKKFHDFIKKYIYSYEWKNKVPNEIKKLYLLLAGIPILDDINICEHLDWKRTFGLYLWYLTPPASPIKYVVNEYNKAFQKYCITSLPKPPYSGQNNESNYNDLLYQILLLYVKGNSHQLSLVLEPQSHTENLMDFRISWILLQLFQSLKIGLIDNCKRNDLHITFSNQLEHFGLWKWSIFVLLYLEDNIVKKTLIMKILERNLSETNDTITIEKELIELMNIPKNWIYEVKGYKALSVNSYYKSFQYFVQIKDWKQTNNIFIRYILPELYNYEHHNYLKDLIKLVLPGKNEIQNWKSEVGLFIDYYKIKNFTSIYNGEEDSNITTIFNGICHRLKKFPLNNDQQKLCIAEFSKSCAFMFKILYKNLEIKKYQSKYLDLVDNMVMPTDYKHYELFYLIDQCLAVMDL